MREPDSVTGLVQGDVLEQGKVDAIVVLNVVVDPRMTPPPLTPVQPAVPQVGVPKRNCIFAAVGLVVFSVNVRFVVFCQVARTARTAAF